MVISFSSILVGDRYRKNYGDLSGLKASLQTVGSIHPIVLSKRAVFGMDHMTENKDLYDLVAGGRRYAAMKELGVTELHHGSVLEPGKLGFLFKAEVPEDELREAELDENLHRMATKWTEDVLAIADVHELKRRKHGYNKWGYRQTAEVFKGGFGEVSVKHALRIAKAIRAGNKEVLEASSISDAMAILIKNKEDEALAELQRRVTPKAVAQPTNPQAFKAFPDLVLPPQEERAATASARVPFIVPSETPTPDRPVVPLSTMFRLGDTLALDWPTVDHIVTDIPYGIDMDNLDTMNIEDVKDTHDVEQNVSMMQDFLIKAYKSVKPGGFCVFFYDLDHHEKLQDWAQEAGFRPQRWPYLALKTSACRNSAAQYNTTKNYECCMFLRKDSQTVLRKPITSSYGEYDFAAERRLYNNPFAKPFALWKFIYDAIAFPGQSVLDPYCGEMSACRAAANCGLVPYGIELSEQHYNRGLEHMRAVYALIHKSNVEFV